MRGALLLLVLPTLAVPETCGRIQAKEVDAYNDKKISQSEMWTVNNLTKAECMFACLREKYCVSFHFSSSGPVCVALRERFEGSRVASTKADGYQLYQTNKTLAKVGSNCELKVDCVSLPNSHCNDGVCRCDVGYGPDGDICRILTECSTFSNNFTLYKNLAIIGPGISSREPTNHESCPEACIATAGCKSADFQNIVCFMNKHTWLGVPVSARLEPATYDFFQRECLW